MFRIACAWLALFCMGSAQADIVVGRLGSLKSPIASPSTVAVAEGFDAYIRKINEGGGLFGEKIRVVFRDDNFDPTQVVAQAKALIDEDRAVAIVNPQGTPGTVALLKDGILARTHVPVLGAFTGASQVLDADAIFPLRSTYEDEVAALCRQMKSLNQKRIAYLYYDTSQGPLFAPVFEKIVRDAGLEYAGATGFAIDANPQRQRELVDRAVEALGALHPDAVFTFAVGPTFAMSMKSIHDRLGPGVIRYTFSINNWESLIQQVGLPVAAGVIFSQAVPYPYGTERRIVADYRRDLHDFGGQSTPSFASLEGYITARVLVDALRRAGPHAGATQLTEALEKLGRYDLGDYVLNYTPVQHRVEPSVDITIIGSGGNLLK